MTGSTLLDLTTRVGPVLIFLVAITVVAEIADASDLRGRYSLQAPPDPHDRTMLIVAGAVCISLGAAFVSGITSAIPASAAALVLIGTALVRNRPLLRAVRIPWFIVLGSAHSSSP